MLDGSRKMIFRAKKVNGEMCWSPYAVVFERISGIGANKEEIRKISQIFFSKDEYSIQPTDMQIYLWFWNCNFQIIRTFRYIYFLLVILTWEMLSGVEVNCIKCR